jgi:HAD superfamily hydrolase (TIGR01509 family)
VTASSETIEETGDPRRTIDAVLFDLHNTTLDGSDAAAGIAHVADLMERRRAIDPSAVGPAFVQGLQRAMSSYIDRDFSLMSDVFLEAFRHIADRLGLDADDAELAELDREMWQANIRAARPTDGAIETIDALRDRGIRVGIVSWADTEVFDRSIEQLGFAEHIDVAVCSEDAQSCKPHPGIFLTALDSLNVAPERAAFVGVSIDGDIVGGNRLGMVTALVAGTEYSSDIDAFGDDPMTVPDHRLSALADILAVVADLRA